MGYSQHMDERRNTLRAQACISGQAALEREASTFVDCVVQNLSPAGACVVFSDQVTAPRFFDLFIGQSGRARRVRTVWRQAGTAGVMFVEARANAPAVLSD